MAEDQGKEEEKFDFTAEGEGYISLDEARVLAMRTAVESPGNYGSAYQGVDMVFYVVEATETDDHYTVILSVRPQGDFLGRPGQEQFVVGKEGTIAVRQVLSSPVRKSGGFPVLPVAIGLVVVSIIAAVGAVFTLGGFGGESVPVAAVALTETPAPTETLAPTQPPAPVVIPADTPEPTVNIDATVEAGIQQGLASRVIPPPIPTATYTPIPPMKTHTPLPYGCFVAGTPVLTSNGYVAIEELRKGDTVFSYDHNFQTRVEADISAIISRKVNDLMSVELADGTTIQVTREHPFYSPDESRYKPIGEFTPGEQLARIGQDEKLKAIGVAGVKAVRGEFTVYNLSVDSSHENYVAAGVLVHNKTPTPSPDQLSTFKAMSHYNKGEEYREAENWVMAIGEYTTAIETNPNYQSAYLDRAISYYFLGQYQNAIADYTRAIQLDPNNDAAYNNRGAAYAELDQYQRAIEDYDKVIQLDGGFPVVYFNRGRNYEDLGQYQRAIQDYTKAIQIDPNYDFAYLNRGNTYYRLSQYQNAINDYTKAIQINPNYAQAYYNRSLSYGNLGQTSNADKAKACSLDSQYC